MAVFTIPVDATRIENANPDLPIAIAEYLTTLPQPYTVNAVTLQANPIPALVIDADRDPTADLAAWTPQASNARAKRQQAKQTFTQFSDAIGAAQSPTLAQTQKALMALGELVLYLAKDREP